MKETEKEQMSTKRKTRRLRFLEVKQARLSRQDGGSIVSKFLTLS